MHISKEKKKRNKKHNSVCYYIVSSTLRMPSCLILQQTVSVSTALLGAVIAL